MPAAASPRRPLFIAAVALLLALHWLLAVGSKTNESVTTDEIAHVTGGFTYWKFNDYRIQPENGNLPQRWAALPAWLEGAKFPPLEGNDAWRVSDTWVLGHQFFYETGQDHFPRLMAARGMIALFSVATGLMIFLWSRRLFGPGGAFVSLTLFVFCPTFLAHGALATSDACIAFLFLASVGAYWRHLHDARLRWGAISAVVFGLACVAKFSAGLLLPMMAVMALARAWAPEALRWGRWHFTTPGRRLGAIVLTTIGHGVVAYGVIWMFFGFRFAAGNPAVPVADQFIRTWAETLDYLGGSKAEIIRWMLAHHLLPEAYLWGLSFVLEMSRFRSAFLDGAYSITGWVRFFPLAFLYKTTLPGLIACGAIVSTAVVRWGRTRSVAATRAALYPLTPLLTLFAVYWITSLTTSLNIGERHLMPTYPVIFILAGMLASQSPTAGTELPPPKKVRARRLGALLLAALLGWQAIAAIRIYPHYLAYFNPIAGGPENGYRHLVDSSLDWGQDLPELKTWLAQHRQPSEPVYLAYAGSGEPAYYQLPIRRLPFVNGFKLTPPWTPLEPGLYCIGATMLQHVYSPIRGPWTSELEQAYQTIRALEPAFAAYASDPATRAKLERTASPPQWQKAWKKDDLLRFARLCHYLRARRPDAEVGYSILIYRLSADEIVAATSGSLDEWKAAVDRAATGARR